MQYKYTIQYNGALLSSFLHLSSEVHLNGGVDAKLGPISCVGVKIFLRGATL